MTVPNFLGEEKVKLPVGGDFQPSGFIGAWFAQVMFSFWSDTDLGTFGDAPAPDNSFKRGRGFQYYYKNPDAAKKASDVCGQKYPPKQHWQWLINRDKILNVRPEDLEKFGDPVSFDLELSTFKAKSRHKLHLIALPSAVAAMAAAYGYDNPGFELADLCDSGIVYTDEYQAKMIGGPDAKDEKDPLHWSHSVLWQRRTALWQALGETNPLVYNPIGTGTKLDTTSEKLSNCLRILALAWKNGLWSRVIQVPDPDMKATYGDEAKRLSIPALVKIYSNQAEAKAEGDRELAERSAREAAKSNGNGTQATKPAIPEMWANEGEAAWVDYCKTLKQQLNGKPVPVQRAFLTEHAGDIGATPDEVMAWLPLVS